MLFSKLAILLARIPKEFQRHHLKELDNTTVKKISSINISQAIPYTTFQILLRFWYTSDFFPEHYNQQQVIVDSPSSSIGSTISNGSTFSTASTKTSVSSCSNSNNKQDELDDLKQSNATMSQVPTEIEQLEQRLGFKLVSTITKQKEDGKMDNYFEQLVADLEQMRGQQLGSDVLVTLFTPAPTSPPPSSITANANNKNSSNNTKKAPSSPTTSTGKEIPSILFNHNQVSTTQPSKPTTAATVTTSQPASFPAHRFILASQSPYFYAMFCTQFREASSSTVHLPGDLFTPITTQVILRYFYSDTLIIPALRKLPSSIAQRRLTEKKHALRVLQQVFPAADYLGHFDTICQAILHEMDKICHGFKCVCGDCAALLPSMLWFADKYSNTIPLLRPALMSLYSDPVHSIAPLWSQQPFAILVGHMSPSATSLAEYTVASIFCNNMDNFHGSTSSFINNGEGGGAGQLNMIISELSQQTLDNVTKHNAIHVLHSLHLCLSQIRSANPFPTWSTSALELIYPILHHTVNMISRNFDFYCVEYPILLSCVDGIGVGFSVDFLEFLLKRVLDKDSIRDSNASILYQGIVRDLVGRQEVVKNVAVDGVLLDARNRCADYLAHRWVQVKAQGGFNKIDKDVMRNLSDGKTNEKLNY